MKHLHLKINFYSEKLFYPNLTMKLMLMNSFPNRCLDFQRTSENILAERFKWKDWLYLAKLSWFRISLYKEKLQKTVFRVSGNSQNIPAETIDEELKGKVNIFELDLRTVPKSNENEWRFFNEWLLVITNKKESKEITVPCTSNRHHLPLCYLSR